MSGTTAKARVLFVSIGDVYRPSSRFRAYWWKECLEREGLQCRVVPYFRSPEKRPPIAFWQPVSRRVLLWRSTYGEILEGSRWADAVIIQEALLPRWLLRRVRALAGCLIFDFSDPVHLLSDQKPPGWLARIHNRYETRPRFRETLRCANYAIVENDELVNTVRELGCRGFVMRGPINTDFFQPCDGGPERLDVNIGWTGTPRTLALLNPVLPVLDRVAQRFTNVRLTLVGADRRPALARMPVELVPWRLESEPRVVREFDIGLLHIADTAWQRARGGGKLLVYMSAGVPVVASPHGIGGQLIEAGQTGLLADTPEEWYQALCRLIADARQRKRMSSNARRAAVEKYSHQAYLPLMLSLIEGKL